MADADNGSTGYLLVDDGGHLAERAVEAISGRWVITVLLELAAGGERRHNDLARATGLEHKTLGRVLQRLERLGLVEREVDPSYRYPRISYVATAWGRSFAEPARVLVSWWNEGGA
jgi:DNA-binding HxlR family transcriptional regulator